MKRFPAFLFLALIVILAGCSCRSWYEGFREMERQRCYEIESPIERQNCLDGVDEMTYDQYKQEREASRADSGKRHPD